MLIRCESSIHGACGVDPDKTFNNFVSCFNIAFGITLHVQFNELRLYMSVTSLDSLK